MRSVTVPSGRTQVAGARRFYDTVEVCHCEDEGWPYEIRLDGKVLRTPTRHSLSSDARGGKLATT